MAARRERADLRPAEGVAPYVLAAFEGAAVMLLWLKIGGLVGLRELPAADFRWANLGASLVLGALLGLGGLALWGRVGPFLLDLLHGDTARRDCRMVWGASGLPQVATILVLLPLDLLLVGPAVFATDKLVDPIATAWAAFSIAVALGLAVWSVFLFLRGTEVTASLPAGRALVAGAGALFCLGAPAAALFFGLAQLSRGLS